jgi:two-component system, LytTR family, sensor kinase
MDRTPAAPPGDPQIEEPPSPSRPPWLLVLGFWAAAWAVFAVLRLVLVFWLDPRGDDQLRLLALLDYGIQYGLWALLTPAIFWLSGRFPLTRRNWVWRAPMHLGIGIAAVLATMLTMFSLHNLYAHAPGRGHPWTLVEISRQMIVYGYHFQLLFYMGILTAGFAFHFYRGLQQQRITTARMQSQLAEARMQALRMQIHPHFLFNTLNTISNLTETDPRTARRVIARLGELLRRALHSTEEQEVSLREELEFAEGYLDIVRERFADRLRIEFGVDPGLEAALVPNLVLQPVLENAMEHGIARTLGEGMIRTEAERVGDRLHLRVSDSGPGLRGEAFVEGVGLSNTRARLQQLYGSEATLDLRDAGTGGVVAEIVLPYRTREGYPADGTGEHPPEAMVQ